MMNKDLTAGTAEWGKTIIVPVGIPGCRKTSVSTVLSNLFGFGHVQSDDIKGSKRAPIFINRVVNLLASHDVVIADKNNHLRQHRRQLREATARFSPSVRLLALKWVLDKPPSLIHRICSDRVAGRGQKHQTLPADMAGKSHERVIWMFIESMEDLKPHEVDAVIDMDIEDTLEQAITRVVNGLAKILNLERPSDEKIAEALSKIDSEGHVALADVNSEVKLRPRYFALLPEVDICEFLERCFSNLVEVDENIANAWKSLKAKHRITLRPHVTIVHKNDFKHKAERDLGDRCGALLAMSPPPTFKGTLGRVLWNGRVMALTLDDFSLDDSDSGKGGAKFVSMLPLQVRQRLHITVATEWSRVDPAEAREMVQSWNMGWKEGIHVQELEGPIVRGIIQGLM